MLLAAEEFLLFLLDEQNGTLLPMTARTEHLVLAGAVLMDLQLAHRIDTDLDNLTLGNPTPLGDDVLDPVLADIAGAEETHDALYWVERTAPGGGTRSGSGRSPGWSPGAFSSSPATTDCCRWHRR